MKAKLSAIREKIVKRAQWIRKQQQYFEQFLPRTPEREYVSGETHYYLGRSYLLKMRKAMEDSVKLSGGELFVRTPNPENRNHVKKILTDWYYSHGLRNLKHLSRKRWLILKPINSNDLNWSSAECQGGGAVAHPMEESYLIRRL
jgi:predicted metal-dependent hydrolase